MTVARSISLCCRARLYTLVQSRRAMDMIFQLNGQENIG